MKAVIFDIDGVLIDSFEANLKFYQDLMSAFGYPGPTREAFPELFHVSMWDSIQKLTGLDDEAQIRKIWLAGKAKTMVSYHVELLNTPSGYVSVIEKLSQMYTLGIVTNRVDAFEPPPVALIKKFFSTAVAYEDTRKHKPDPEPLLLAAQRLRVQPQECVYIGDVQNDVIAARAAGMKMIGFTRYSKTKLKDTDANTDTFSGLPQLIHSL